MPRFAIAPLGLTTEGSTKIKLKGWKWYLKKLQCILHGKTNKGSTATVRPRFSWHFLDCKTAVWIDTVPKPQTCYRNSFSLGKIIPLYAAHHFCTLTTSFIRSALSIVFSKTSQAFWWVDPQLIWTTNFIVAVTKGREKSGCGGLPET